MTDPAPARVVATFGRHFLLRDSAGHLLHATRRAKRGDVVIGDMVRYVRQGDQAVIESIEPRRSLLFRADPLRTKALAANIDQVAIVFAPQPPFSVRFVWRALAAAAAARIDALAVLNKIDIEDGLAAARAALEGVARLGVATVALSARTAAAEARTLFASATAGRATLLVGQSGMGKSTLLNLRLPDANARTQDYSRRLNAGRQTTTASRWFDLPARDGGGALVDTPGFQEFGLAHLPRSERAAVLPDFAPMLGQCRFNDCRHRNEPGCAVRDAVQAGRIDADRYAFYLELLDEPERF